MWNPDMLEPLHAVYRRSALLGYLESHTSLSLREMVRSLNARYIKVEDLRGFDPDLLTFTNINKIEELEHFNAAAFSGNTKQKSVPKKNPPEFKYL
jgi:molybdopterin-guanine dinucleotide biosynthesis protein A